MTQQAMPQEEWFDRMREEVSRLHDLGHLIKRWEMPGQPIGQLFNAMVDVLQHLTESQSWEARCPVEMDNAILLDEWRRGVEWRLTR